MKRLTLLLLLIGSSVVIIAQNAILPVTTTTGKEKTFASLLPEIAHAIHKRLEIPVCSSELLPAVFSKDWCPLEIANCPGRQTKYLIIITLDGFRWQEFFIGADTALMHQPTGGKYFGLPRADTPLRQREHLLPFFWNKLAKEGQAWGNRQIGSTVNVTNKSCISYPGYSEIFTGFADDAHIYTNFKIRNRNTNVLDFINSQSGYRGRVASFTSWDVFPDIFSEKMYGFYINAAFETVSDDDFLSINQSLRKSVRPWGNHVRPDTLTFRYAQKYLETHLPRVLHIGLGETDEYAHEGKYDRYLQAAQTADSLIGNLWEFVQQHPLYRNKTTLVVTTDHGRGKRQDTWQKHHLLIDGSDEIWLAMIGPDLSADGEMRNSAPIFQSQLAGTLAGMLGLDFKCGHPVAKGIFD